MAGYKSHLEDIFTDFTWVIYKYKKEKSKKDCPILYVESQNTEQNISFSQKFFIVSILITV